METLCSKCFEEFTDPNDQIFNEKGAFHRSCWDLVQNQEYQKAIVDFVTRNRNQTIQFINEHVKPRTLAMRMMRTLKGKAV